jgi:hypothetical protein
MIRRWLPTASFGLGTPDASSGRLAQVRARPLLRRSGEREYSLCHPTFVGHSGRSVRSLAAEPARHRPVDIDPFLAGRTCRTRLTDCSTGEAPAIARFWRMEIALLPD